MIPSWSEFATTVTQSLSHMSQIARLAGGDFRSIGGRLQGFSQLPVVGHNSKLKLLLLGVPISSELNG
jgi:hypothetical protein